MGNASTSKRMEPIDILKLKQQSKRNLTSQSSGQGDAKNSVNAKIKQRMDSFASQPSDTEEEAAAATVDYSERIISSEYGPTITLGSADLSSVDAQLLLKYQVLELLGGGSYSQVLLCRRLPTQQPRRSLLRQHSNSHDPTLSSSGSTMRTTSLEHHSVTLMHSLNKAATSAAVAAASVTNNCTGAAELAAGKELVAVDAPTTAPPTTPTTATTTTTTTTTTTPSMHTHTFQESGTTPTDHHDHVAIKIIPKPTGTTTTDADYEEYTTQMRQEAAIMKLVSSHAHIVLLHEFLESPVNFYMVLESCRYSCMKTIGKLNPQPYTVQ